MKKKAIVVVGATASGKTALGVHIAKKFNGEVISADSMQIYKGMDIATAKPTTEEMDGITHHLIDFVDVKSQYSVSDYLIKNNFCIITIIRNTILTFHINKIY